MMPLSRLDCPLSLETAHMGNPGSVEGFRYQGLKMKSEGCIHMDIPDPITAQRYRPPPNPTMLTDSRARGHIARYGH